MTIDYGRLNRNVRDKFGVTLLYTPINGNNRLVTGIIDRNYFADTGGMGIQTHNCIIQIVDADMPELSVGDRFVLGAETYIAIEIKPDFQGMTEVIVNEV